jgi:hypothetical protein
MIHNVTEQEKFVIDILKGKENGYYVELGAAHYSKGNNTYSLEKDYNWTGVSFEIVESMKDEFNANRKNPCMGDALSFNYIDYFEKNNFPKQIDYLQLDMVDCDESIQKINEAYTRMVKSDVKYRFVIDLASLS